MIEKKCSNCEHMLICKLYYDLCQMAHLLNSTMRLNPLNQTGFEVLSDTMAHDCTKFEGVPR